MNLNIFNVIKFSPIFLHHWKKFLSPKYLACRILSKHLKSYFKMTPVSMLVIAVSIAGMIRYSGVIRKVDKSWMYPWGCSEPVAVNGDAGCKQPQYVLSSFSKEISQSLNNNNNNNKTLEAITAYQMSACLLGVWQCEHRKYTKEFTVWPEK